MTKPKQIFPLRLVLAVLIVTSHAVAQPATLRSVEIANATAPSESIATARGEYTNAANGDGTTRDAGDRMQLAQFSGRPPHLPQRAYPSVYRQPPRMDYGEGKHALIGAVIGFGLGSAIGAKANSDSHPGATVGAVVLVGGIGALMGALVGANHGRSYPFAHHRKLPPAPGKDEDLDQNADSAGPRFGGVSDKPSAETSASLAH
jgi:hypothetical protein